MIKLNHVFFKHENGIQNNGLSDVSLHVKKGEVVLLCGESGCGKTTLTRLINGLIPHYFSGNLSGEIEINEKSIRKTPLAEISKYVGSVFQNPRTQFYCLDTNSELAFSCENQGLPIDDILSRIEGTISHLNIQHLINRNIFNLSGGEKQKIAYGCVHTASPDIIVLDEPSSNLDSYETSLLGQVIAHWKNEGKTIVVAEHRLHFLSDIADRMIFMRDGKIAKELSMAEAKRLKPQDLSSMGLRALNTETLSLEDRHRDRSTQEIQLSNFNYAYTKDKKALNIDAFNLPKGQIIGIIGHNGAGKSTFARCLCGLNRKFKGNVIVDKNTFNMKQCLENAYMVMQDVNHQLFTETVLDEVILSMNEDNIEKTEAILESLNLLHMKDSHPMSLSGGQKQRVAIASAIASERDIIIFDEPTSGLDFRHMIQVAENIDKLKKLGKTILIITHDLELILKTCDHILHLKNGQVYKSFHLDDTKTNYLISVFKHETEQ
ncbi:ABC transporter ATP-binding protein [Paraliobacillus sp. JSM ZJ581]|uniref:ABC transporter ATP-binding protein n=1 Tax=Paraliobacillus sp. JSM ZJ581 TaxID=3342118 RepID=UPI0035A8C52F